MPDHPRATTGDLLAFIADSPSPFHAVAAAAARLEQAGFREMALDGPWPAGIAPAYVRRGGTLVAWRPAASPSGFRIVGAHTDSPNLRIKPQPDHRSAGFRQLGVEVYGGVLLNSWLDRDLGLSGRVSVLDDTRFDDTSAVTRLFRIDRPVLRVPQLAIHLDRDVNERGLILNRQSHLSPVWGVGPDDGRGFRELLAAELDVDPGRILAWDAMCHDLAPPTYAGVDEDLLSAPRIDNLLSCHAAVTALGEATDDVPFTQVVTLFDHEEVGSTTDRGAASSFLGTVLERISAAGDVGRSQHLQALAGSHCVSADGAHATHPNYPERHEPDHPVALNGGPVVKVNASARYATDAESAAPFLAACAASEVPVQWFVTRSDLACGSTIGPLTAAQLGVPTVDVGIAQLAMHSCRELTGALDPPRFVAALTAYLNG